MEPPSVVVGPGFEPADISLDKFKELAESTISVASLRRKVG
jgi:hypothetical protein